MGCCRHMTGRTTGRGLFMSFRNTFGPTKLRHGCPGILSCRNMLNVRRNNGYGPRGDVCLPFVHGTIKPVSFAPNSVVSTRPRSGHSAQTGTVNSKAHTFRVTLFVVFRDNLRVLTSGPICCCERLPYARFVADIPIA